MESEISKPAVGGLIDALTNPGPSPLDDFGDWMQSGVFPAYDWFAERGFGGWRRSGLKDGILQFDRRRQFVREYGFAIPCREAIGAIAKLSPLVEVGAGSGYWAASLAAAGADIIATDAEARHQDSSPYGFQLGAHYLVSRVGGKRAVLNNPRRNVLMCWPSYQERWARLAASAIQPGRALALIGEGAGGCTGDDSLFALLDRAFEHIDQIAIPQFWGINDRLDIFKRR